MMDRHRRSLISAALLMGALATGANAQYGGRSRKGSDAASGRAAGTGDSGTRGVASQFDPLAAIERELPSLRIDLKMTTEQAPLFDSFERQLRDSANAERMRARHLASMRVDQGNTVTADTVLGTIADDDALRAESTRLALERMTVLYAALVPEQRRQFDQRIIQSLREPLGTS